MLRHFSIPEQGYLKQYPEENLNRSDNGFLIFYQKYVGYYEKYN